MPAALAVAGQHGIAQTRSRPGGDTGPAGEPGRVQLDAVGHDPGLRVLDRGGGPVNAPTVGPGLEVGDLEARAGAAVLPARGRGERGEGHRVSVAEPARRKRFERRPPGAYGWRYARTDSGVPSSSLEPVMRLRRSRRRRFRFMRTGALLTVIGLMRLVRVARVRWRISLGLCGVLLEVLGHSVFSGPARGAADLLGLVVVTVAVLKSEGSAEASRPAVPQVVWRRHG